MSRRRCLNFAGAAAIVVPMGLIAGCASAPPRSVPTPPLAVAAAPSTQPVIDSCQNQVNVEFGSQWSSYRFASESNAAAVNITRPATQPAELPPPPIAAPGAAGSSTAQTDRGSVTPAALRGNSTADVLGGSASADAVRGSVSVDEDRGAVHSTVAHGSCTVQVLRGDAEVIAAGHQNTSELIRPDLSVTLAADPPAAAPGDTVIYTLTIKNISTIEARDVTVADYLPEQMQFLSARGATPVVDPDDSSTHLAVPGSIPPGGSVQVQLMARVK